MPSSFLLLATEPGRQRLVTFALRVVHGTPLDPDPYELQLLAGFVHGELSFDQLEQQLDARAVDAWPAPALFPACSWVTCNSRV